MLGSPIAIMVLLEIYSRSGITHKQEDTNMRNASWKSEAADNARELLEDLELIHCTTIVNRDDCDYQITDLGRAMVRGLCTLELPKLIYRFNENHEVNT